MKARTSEPPASLTNCWTRKLASRPRKASITDSAAFFVSHSTTPMPCVPSVNLTTRGAPPTISMSPSVSFVEFAKPVIGNPMPRRDRICSERNLSRERVIAWDSFSE